METMIMKQQTKASITPPLPPMSQTIGLSSAVPRDKLCEYLLLFNADGDVGDRIIKKKEYFSYAYENPAALYGRPHITLANFLLLEIGENEIIKHLKIISENSNRIKVVLKDYKWFPTHTMYLNVLYKVDIKQLVRRIDAGIGRVIRRNNEYPPHFILEPHLTICKDLTVEQYQKSRIEFGEEAFSGEFTADKMILIKRSVQDKKYQEVSRFELKGHEALNTTIQGDLFQ